MEMGLLPPPTDTSSVAAPIEPPLSGTSMRELYELARAHANDRISVPEPPPPTAFQQSGGYGGWETDRIDASSFDALTNSVNAILAKMSPEDGQNFDKIVKYLLLQATKDPSLAGKAATGQQPSDEELLRIIQSYLDRRTPVEALMMAKMFADREEAQPAAAPQRRRSGLAMPAVSPYGDGTPVAE